VNRVEFLAEFYALMQTVKDNIESENYTTARQQSITALELADRAEHRRIITPQDCVRHTSTLKHVIATAFVGGFSEE
jgi:ribosomal protein S20